MINLLNSSGWNPFLIRDLFETVFSSDYYWVPIIFASLVGAEGCAGEIGVFASKWRCSVIHQGNQTHYKIQSSNMMIKGAAGGECRNSKCGIPLALRPVCVAITTYLDINELLGLHHTD